VQIRVISFVYISCPALVNPIERGSASTCQTVWHVEVLTVVSPIVQAATNKTGDAYVPPEHRIATFDNDGTLWVSQLYVQLEFALARVHELAPQHPEWQSTQPFQAILENDRRL